MKKLSKSEMELLTKFKKEVCLNKLINKELDEEYWGSLAVGYFLALGCNIEISKKLALEAAYEYEFWIT